MPSVLRGLFKTLAWSDFAVRPEAPPKAGQVAVAARTDTTNSLVARPEQIPETKKFRLADTVQVNIFLNASGTFQKSWVATTMSQSQRDDLLSHEQGHYDIHALLSRDFFLAVMELKSNEYDTPGGLTVDINAAQRATTDKSSAVQATYDTETGTGSKPTEQAKWKAMIQSAFDTAASPPRSAADGTPIKVTLLSVLSQNGFNF
jgi:hypothetical protein